jgi:hypothetical protein
MISVWVDWSQTRYADIDGLPGIINNFPADLGPAQAAAPKSAAPKSVAKPKRPFHLKPLAPIHLEPETDSADVDAETRVADPKPSLPQDEDEAPPTLRLI